MTELPSSVTEQYFKQIVHDETTGHLSLLDPRNKSFECNIYGNPIRKFDFDITGKADYAEREKRNLIKTLFLNQDRRLYRPQNRRFEGYSQFPRPLSQPFINENCNKTLLIKTLVKNKQFTRPENAKLLKLKTNHGLSFMSSSIPSENKTDKKQLIKLIDNTCKEYDSQEKMNQNHKYSQANINSLKKLKQIVLLNSKDMVYGRRLPKPTDLAKNQYQTIVELYSNIPNEKIQIKNQQLKNSASIPCLLVEENPFEKAKKKSTKGDTSIDFLSKHYLILYYIVTAYKEKEDRKEASIKGERFYRMKCKEEKRLLSGFKVIDCQYSLCYLETCCEGKGDHSEGFSAVTDKGRSL